MKTVLPDQVIKDRAEKIARQYAGARLYIDDLRNEIVEASRWARSVMQQAVYPEPGQVVVAIPVSDIEKLSSEEYLVASNARDRIIDRCREQMR